MKFDQQSQNYYSSFKLAEDRTKWQNFLCFSSATDFHNSEEYIYIYISLYECPSTQRSLVFHYSIIIIIIIIIIIVIIIILIIVIIHRNYYYSHHQCHVCS
jgi:hypothetical protein